MSEEFLDSQAQIEENNYISGEESEEDDEDDYNPKLYYRFSNVTRNDDEATEDALNNQQPQTEEVSNYCQEFEEIGHFEDSNKKNNDFQKSNS